MTTRFIICFPSEDAPGLRAQAAQLAYGIQECGHSVTVLGELGGWRRELRDAGIEAVTCDFSAHIRMVAPLINSYNPEVIHAFGAETTRRMLHLAPLLSSACVATLGMADFAEFQQHELRDAGAIFVLCEKTQDKIARKFPRLPLHFSGYALPATPNVLADNALAPPAITNINTPQRPLVLLADNFDAFEAELAYEVINAAPRLAARFSGIQFVIVGNGDCLDSLQERAKHANMQLGRELVLVTGQRNDIARLLTLATVVIGSGRFAAEAIAAGVPCIAASSAGMIGTVTPNCFSQALESCFGRYGDFISLSSKALLVEVDALLNHPIQRKKFAASVQKLLMANYARNKVAQFVIDNSPVLKTSGKSKRKPNHISAILPDDLRELLFTLPAIHALRMHFPLAEVRLIARPAHHSLLGHIKMAEEIFSKPEGPRGWWRFAMAQLQSRTDVCFSFCEDIRAAWMTALSWAQYRLGYVDSKGSLFFSDHLHTSMPASPTRAMLLTQIIGIEQEMPFDPPEIPHESWEKVRVNLRATGVAPEEPIILLSPEVDANRSWPKEHWLELAALLLAERKERIAVIGAAQLPWPDGIIKVVPVSDSLLLATLLLRSAVVVAPENAHLHLADMLRVPTVGIYGPTNPEAYKLPNPNSHPIFHREFPCHPCSAPCADLPCLKAITPDEIMKIIIELVE